ERNGGAFLIAVNIDARQQEDVSVGKHLLYELRILRAVQLDYLLQAELFDLTLQVQSLRSVADNVVMYGIRSGAYFCNRFDGISDSFDWYEARDCKNTRAFALLETAGAIGKFGRIDPDGQSTQLFRWAAELDKALPS